MTLKNQTLDGGSYRDSDVKTTNSTGTPIVSATFNGDGRAAADIYLLTFASVVAGVSANVTVNASGNNPYRATRAVALDGVTVHKDVIPGLDIIFSVNAGFTNSWAAELDLGEWEGTYDAFGAGAGTPSAGKRERVQNTGTGVVSAAKARLLPIVVWVKKVGVVFAKVGRFAEGSTEKLAGGGSVRVMPYVMSIANIAGSGAGKTCDIRVDGVAFGAGTLTDLSTGGAVSGIGVKAVAGQGYRVNSGALTGVEFYIDPACSNADTANLLIFASRFVQIAPDVAGAAGTYGTADVTLTEAGQAAGSITAGGLAYYWKRNVVPAGGNPESNPYPTDVALQGVETGAAGWLV
jgi:hypothetical protein